MYNVRDHLLALDTLAQPSVKQNDLKLLVHLIKALLYRNFPCFIALLTVEMHSNSIAGNFQASLSVFI